MEDIRRRPISPGVAGSLVIGVFVALLLGELRSPLRRSTMPKLKRQVRNVIIALLGAVTSAVAEAPIVQPLARLTEEKRWGLLGRARLPFWMEATLALLLMDYSFYFWHILLHRVPLLWRFHAVHHVDQDMDASTALRFHAGELLFSVPLRAAQVAVIGLTPRTFSLWQIWFALCVMFQHSNVRIPIEWERRLNRVLVTPRMHGIHHSGVPEETDSNWSSGLTVWDWLHGSLRLNVPQQAITIGVPAFFDQRSTELKKVLAMPFRTQPEYWRGADGIIPEPHFLPCSPTRLLE